VNGSKSTSFPLLILMIT